jgi:hypothetical protein
MKRIFTASIFLLAVTLACIVPPVVSTPTAQPVPTAEKILAKPEKILATVTAYQSLHVRVRPGEHEPLAEPGYLYHGETVTLTSKCQTGWAQIEWQDGTAWVRAKFLSENKCSEE